ncbi:hypothetical protein [Pleionea litopenaei]|uniref:TFIIS-type domain-containing protein n=1 Tax=Pleionea litopenaei TaxID=3070815 RepID=A0AA51RWG4_9GAMM|nr:hypothetical protein [Pleionea sp. HL-JVS1]WMS88921.1 hypothetical protein Q9312_08390 [Pleionea sp. HL-JVS1]
MADRDIVPKCSKCNGTSFSAVKTDVKNADNSMVFICCTSCAQIISVVPYSAAWDK